MYDYNWKQERIDGVMKEISGMTLADIARLILTERFHRKATKYEVEWLDELADALRDGGSFNENTLYKEMYADPKKELVKRYKNT